MTTMREWLARDDPDPLLTVLGAPIGRASISPSEAWSTPPAFRAALARFPSWESENGSDIHSLRVHDGGDVEGDRDDTDAAAAHARLEAALARVTTPWVVVVGGDNSLTRPALLGLQRARPAERWGLLTLDAHHDCRAPTDGPRNGTPVRDLIESGLPGDRVAQVGIHPLGNAADVAAWAHAHGVHVHPLADVRARGIEAVVGDALDQLTAAGSTAVYVDLDIDVVDRAAAPACPASLPGGLAAGELLAAARLLGGDSRVVAADLTEVDASADVAGITVRLLAAAFTMFVAGLASRG